MLFDSILSLGDGAGRSERTKDYQLRLREGGQRREQVVIRRYVTQHATAPRPAARADIFKAVAPVAAPDSGLSALRDLTPS
ncbi:hypothetical protein EVAR_93967_1 [Eumeta japonica]|uniref:Uncharacterized protein n=1 Tax=Eumeta variegata TaxID=151549 RepID=A0A4C1TP92_EUMVA|nr:hypothetical protein EVAR_93967_1 [Eumeta japonica]